MNKKNYIEFKQTVLFFCCFLALLLLSVFFITDVVEEYQQYGLNILVVQKNSLVYRVLLELICLVGVLIFFAVASYLYKTKVLLFGKGVFAFFFIATFLGTFLTHQLAEKNIIPLLVLSGGLLTCTLTMVIASNRG